MFDIGFWEVFLIGIIALFVVGPERLPDLARKAGMYYSKLSRFISGVKADIDREMGAGNLAELKEVQDQFRQAQQEFKSAGNSIMESVPNPKLDEALINAPAKPVAKKDAVEANAGPDAELTPARAEKTAPPTAEPEKIAATNDQ